jgi:YD repeat-containing protein
MKRIVPGLGIFVVLLFATSGRAEQIYTYDSADGVITRFHYDDLGRLTQNNSVSVGTNTTVTGMTYNYYDNTLMALESPSGGGSTTITAYDGTSLGQLTTTSPGVSLQGLTMTPDQREVFTYDATDGRILDYQYDGRGQLHETNSVDTGGRVVTAFTYTTDDRLVVAETPSGGGNSTIYFYDPNTLTQVGTPQTLTQESDGLTTSYRYNDLYSYDALDRMVTRYTYDGNGNLTPQNSVSTGSDTVGGLTYTYDDNELLISRTDAGGHTTVYSYDALTLNPITTQAVGGTAFDLTDAAAIPEPASGLLAGVGGLILAGYARRRRNPR